MSVLDHFHIRRTSREFIALLHSSLYKVLVLICHLECIRSVIKNFTHIPDLKMSDIFAKHLENVETPFPKLGRTHCLSHLWWCSPFLNFEMNFFKCFAVCALKNLKGSKELSTKIANCKLLDQRLCCFKLNHESVGREDVTSAWNTVVLSTNLSLC